MIVILLILVFLIGAGTAITGLVLWGVFDINAGSTLAKIGICLMVAPIIVGIIVGTVILLLALFGLVLFI